MTRFARPAHRLGALIAGVFLIAACGRNDDPQLTALEVDQPDGWDDELALNIPVDINPDPNILEIELEAQLAEIEFREGFTTPAWTYGGTVPGPFIKAKVGDTIIVHFRNSLPEPTSIHWHGMRVPNEMDGVPGVTQDPVPSGGEFRYEFVARDAGTFWYHPHINSAAQVGWGMYGPIVVEDPDDPPEFGDDLVLVLSDIGIAEGSGDFLPVDTGGLFGDLFGREGTVLLVNGKVRPTLKVRAGKQQRWRIINTARARYYTIGVPGHTLVRLGGDNGLAARSAELPNFVLVPGERADIVFTPSAEPGETTMFRWVPTERGFGSVFNRPREDMMAIRTVDEPPVIPSPIPVELREIEPIDIEGAVERTLDMTIDLSNNDVVMGFNGIPHWSFEPIEARIGETHVWTLTNETIFAHPFHLHGYFFQVLDDTLIPEWKDTIDIPVESAVRIAIRFDDRPGAWMYHCHILDHAEAGMMGQLHVLP